MKIEKKLHQQNENINKDILREGQALYDSLATQYCEATPTPQPVKTQGKNFKLRLTVILSCVLVAIFVVSITWIFYPSGETEYLTQNETTVDTALDEVYKSINNSIKINTSDYTVKAATKIYDAPSNDTLYYNLSFEAKEGFASGHIYVVVNNNYTFLQKYDDLPLQATINSFEINYTRNSEDIGGVFLCEYFGCITLQNHKIYFLYEDVVEREDASPVVVLDSLFSEMK